MTAIHDIREHGVKGDGRIPDTEGIQECIDTCSDEGGGTVTVPPGRYLSGRLTLRSDITFYLDAGAVLLASKDPADYAGGEPALLVAHGEENLSVLGSGMIDGQVTADLGRRPGHALEPRPSFRTSLVRITDCHRVRFRDITLANSDAWTVHFRRCRNVLAEGLVIDNNYYRTNTDGINPDSCRGVHISNCDIRAGDDGICLKTTSDAPCEDVVVSNCTIESIATAIKLGTESKSDFRNVMVSNCTIRNSTVGLGIYVKDGATVERVGFSNISIETLRESAGVNAPRLGNATYPVFFDLERRSEESPIGSIRDISLSNIQISSDNGALIQGMVEKPLENISMRNITFRVFGPFDYFKRVKHAGGRSNPRDDRIAVHARKPSYFTIANVRGLTVQGLRTLVAEEAMQRYGRSALLLNEIADGAVSSVSRNPPGGTGARPVVLLEDCRRILLTECCPLPGGGLYLGIKGGRCERIRVAASELDADEVELEGAEESALEIR